MSARARMRSKLEAMMGEWLPRWGIVSFEPARAGEKFYWVVTLQAKPEEPTFPTELPQRVRMRAIEMGSDIENRQLLMAKLYLAVHEQMGFAT